MNVSIDVKLPPTMRRIADALGSLGRREMSEAMGVEVQQVTVTHLAGIAATNHDTANRLGAAPSNFLAQAAEKVAAPSALTASADAATLTINHPGMARAFHDITIVPVKAKALAIPINAIAYNRRPGQFQNLFILGGKKNDTGRAVLAQSRGEGQPPLALFLLVRSVTQKQNRGLLPSDAEWTAAAGKGARNFIARLLTAGGKIS